jgi:hypothetical protein
VQRMDSMLGVHGGCGSSQRLRDYLSAKHSTPGVVRALTDKEIGRNLLEVHQFKKGRRQCPLDTHTNHQTATPTSRFTAIQPEL